MANFNNYDELVELVDANEDVFTVKMGSLRDAHDVGRLGKHVRKNISKRLRSQGLGHYPKDELPSSQHDEVRIFRLGTPTGDLIQAVTQPGTENDEAIRSTVNSDAQARLDRVKELVCDL